MNRRTFIAAASAAVAFSTQRAFGQIETNKLSGTTFVSDLTGATIDLGNTGFEFLAQFLDSEVGDEMVSFRNDTHHVSVRFVPAGTDAEVYLDNRFTAIDEQSEVAEVLGRDVMDDGGWMALSSLSLENINHAFYLEFQLGAFPGYDLEVSMNAEPDVFHDGFDLVEDVLLEGMEPFLFIQDSNILSLDFPVLAAAGSSRSSRASGDSQSGRSSRGRRSTSGQTETPAAGDDDVIEAVRAHQAQFHGELDDLDAILDRITNSPDLEAEAIEIFGELGSLATVWEAYPTDADALVFPASLADLETTYRDWATVIGEMGNALGSWSRGLGELDAFIDALDTAFTADDALEAVLDGLEGSKIRPGHVDLRGLKHRVVVASAALGTRGV